MGPEAVHLAWFVESLFLEEEEEDESDDDGEDEDGQDDGEQDQRGSHAGLDIVQRPETIPRLQMDTYTVDIEIISRLFRSDGGSINTENQSFHVKTGGLGPSLLLQSKLGIDRSRDNSRLP